MMVLGSVGLGFKIILNFVLIPLYGCNGSAVATVLSEFIIFAGATLYLYKYHIRLPIFKIAIKPILASALAYVTFLSLDMIPMILLAVLTGIIYIAAIFLLKVFEQDEIDTFLDNVRKMFKIPKSAKQTVDS